MSDFLGAGYQNFIKLEVALKWKLRPSDPPPPFFEATFGQMIYLYFWSVDNASYIESINIVLE